MRSWMIGLLLGLLPVLLLPVRSAQNVLCNFTKQLLMQVLIFSLFVAPQFQQNMSRRVVRH